MLIEKEMVIAEVRACHMPMEVLRFQIESEEIREQIAQLTRYLFDSTAT